MNARPATPADAPALSDLFLATRRVALPYLPELHAAPDVQRWMRDVVIARSRTFVALGAAGEPVGFAAVRPGHLDHLYVATCAQGRGVGARLLAVAKRASPQGLSLFTFQRNLGARRFYERRGFRLVQLRDGAENEENEPDAVYGWRPLIPPRPILL